MDINWPLGSKDVFGVLEYVEQSSNHIIYANNYFCNVDIMGDMNFCVNVACSIPVVIMKWTFHSNNQWHYFIIYF